MVKQDSSSANRLRVLRAERRITQLEVAKRLQISTGTYWLIENGHREASADERAALARILDVDQDDLGFPSAAPTEARA